MAGDGERKRLDAAYHHCREIARVHSKTFYLSSRFLAPQKRRAVWAVYAFCRTADDIVDRSTAPNERLAAVDAWESQLYRAYEGTATDPIFIAFADAAARFGIPIEPALDLLRGARMDITVRRYLTYDQLREYCYLVASTVGVLVLPILGTRSADALPYAIELGRAMQMTNILRDVGEDARMGRIYLPAEDLERFGYTEADLTAQTVNDAFVNVLRFEIERVRELYRQAEPGIALLDPESRYTVRLALHLYRRILDAIEANGYDTLSMRAYVSMPKKVLYALPLMFAR